VVRERLADLQRAPQSLGSGPGVGIAGVHHQGAHRVSQCFLAMTTGAAQKRFCVKNGRYDRTAASRITSRSLRFGLRTPAIATPSSTPRTDEATPGRRR